MHGGFVWDKSVEMPAAERLGLFNPSVRPDEPWGLAQVRQLDPNHPLGDMYVLEEE